MQEVISKSFSIDNKERKKMEAKIRIKVGKVVEKKMK